jgi:hypothetical protein
MSLLASLFHSPGSHPFRPHTQTRPGPPSAAQPPRCSSHPRCLYAHRNSNNRVCRGDDSISPSYEDMGSWHLICMQRKHGALCNCTQRAHCSVAEAVLAASEGRLRLQLQLGHTSLLWVALVCLQAALLAQFINTQVCPLDPILPHPLPHPHPPSCELSTPCTITSPPTHRACTCRTRPPARQSSRTARSKSASPALGTELVPQQARGRSVQLVCILVPVRHRLCDMWTCYKVSLVASCAQQKHGIDTMHALLVHA